MREVYVGKQRVRLRKARIPVTNENADALAVLDLFNQLDPKAVHELDWCGVINYIKENGLSQKK